MKIKGLIDEDFVNYKKPSMVISFPKCSFKCDKECGENVCQNSLLAHSPDIEISISSIINRYKNNPITKAIVMSGLEPFDSFIDLIELIKEFRKQNINDDIVIYTGYTEEEKYMEIYYILKKYSNIYLKVGRFIPNKESHYDKILGIKLASPNQYGIKIS